MSVPDFGAELAPRILENVIGRTLIIGEPPEPLFLAAAASADEILMSAPKKAVAHCAALARERDLAPVRTMTAERRRKKPSPIESLLVFAMPDGADPLDLLGRALSRTCDGAFVLFAADTSAETARRVKRLFDMTTRDREARDAGRRTIITAVRDAQGFDAPERAMAPMVDAAILFYVDRATADVQAAIFDWLFRETSLASLMIVLDDAIDPAQRVPDDLWGAAEMSFTQPAILRTEGAGKGEAYAIGLEHVEEKRVVFADASARPAPGLLRALDRRLARSPRAGAAFVAGLMKDGRPAADSVRPEGAGVKDGAAAVLDGLRVRPGAAMFLRKNAMRARTALASAAPAENLFLDVAHAAETEFIRAPLIFDLLPAAPDTVHETARRALERVTVPAIRRKRPDLAAAERLRRALSTRAFAAARAGLTSVLDRELAALARIGATPDEITVARLVAALFMNDLPAAMKVAQGIDQRRVADERALNVATKAAILAGDPAAERFAGAALAAAPDSFVAAMNLCAIRAKEASSAAYEAFSDAVRRVPVRAPGLGSPAADPADDWPWPRFFE